VLPTSPACEHPASQRLATGPAQPPPIAGRFNVDLAIKEAVAVGVQLFDVALVQPVLVSDLGLPVVEKLQPRLQNQAVHAGLLDEQIWVQA
jgi:hypothetical protein